MKHRSETSRKRIKAAGLFGKITPLPAALPNMQRDEDSVPECAAFEDDFASYLARLQQARETGKSPLAA